MQGAFLVHFNIKNNTNWYINPYTKTIAGKRIITLDEDTLSMITNKI